MSVGHLQSRAWQDAVTDSSTTAKYPLGTIRDELDVTTGMKKYRYVLANATVANGTPCMYSDLYKREIHTTVASAKRGQPSGVGVGAIASGSYGWIQCAGYHATVLTNGDDDIAAGDTVIQSSTDAVVDSVAAGTATTYKPYGVATTADVDANNTVAVMLDCV